MVLLADVAVVGLIASACAVAFAFCRRSACLLAIVAAPLVAAAAAFPVPFLALALVFRGAGMGGTGHARSEKAALQLALLALCAMTAAVVAQRVARALDARAMRSPPSGGWAGSVTLAWLWQRRAVLGLAVLLCTPVVWHEHRFWRTYEIVARERRDGYRAADATFRLARLGDRRALPLLRRLAPTRPVALAALPAMGVDGDAALVELAQQTPTPERVVDVLTALCKPSAYGPGVPRTRSAIDMVVRFQRHDDPGVRAVAAACVAPRWGASP